MTQNYALMPLIVWRTAIGASQALSLMYREVRKKNFVLLIVYMSKERHHGLAKCGFNDLYVLLICNNSSLTRKILGSF